MRALLPMIAATGLAGLLLPAGAAEIAEHRNLGFSPAGDVFAFEEFGIQDGSGFPFSNIYVIDTGTDSWLPGTPFRILIEDEAATLAEARAQARQAAGPLLVDSGIEDTGLVLAASPLGEFEADPASLSFAVPLPSDARAEPRGRYRASLETFEADTPAMDCAGMMGEPARGFRLRLENLDTGTATILHEDASIPASRGCPMEYRLSEVVVPGTFPPARAVMLVSVIGLGFEGAGRRFMAVAGALPE